MSRVLKILINIILACALISAALLLVPSFMGIETIIIQNKRVETNLAVGSVTYGRERPIDEVKVGDSIYVENKDGSEYLYKVDAVDASTGTLIIRDASDRESESAEVVMDKVCVRIVTIPVIGYLAAMAGSVKGWIIIGLVILLLILLFVISEMWEKDGEAREEEKGQFEAAREDTGELSAKKKKKLEQKQKRQEEKAAKKAAKKNKKSQKGQDMEEPEVRGSMQPVTETESPAALFEAAREEIASSVASAMTEGVEEPEVKSETDPTIDLERQITEELARAAREPDSVQEMTDEEMDMEGENIRFAGEAGLTEAESQEIVIPCCTADELLRKAVLAGDEPEIYEDKEMGITFFDYSEVL